MPRYPHVLFDLDGTLIDSAPAILASYREAFAAAGREAVMPIDAGIVGPPLLETLQMLAGTRDAGVIEALAAHFKASYDTRGYRETAAYEGVGEMLARLVGAGCRLSIATNKRLHPTQLILAHLGWAAHFDAVYALDLFEPRLPHKAAMIARLLQDRGIAREQAVYVGDRSEDGESADANGLPFLAATWGYGSLAAHELAPHWRAVATPAALADAILAPSAT
ncbi:MAG TPA: HAD hydrolase-like protein [Thauera sp.]|uniref:HAD family hydrolase n=1 Tax=Thauera sp. TaxID=1905334 RepID=UPI002C80C0B7|nr:HAD hydrolase-like protein [Thauera sp.]HRP26065.1 HAD hydrolase-like protein [Thauera sp.]HRP66965.1 HAD hydrolase-like protein [Thauera sp.]